MDCPLCGGLDRGCWMRFCVGFAEHDVRAIPEVFYVIRGQRGSKMNQYTADLSDLFFLKLATIADELEADPMDLLAVMQNESGVRAAAKNPHADANGLIQFMGDTLRGLGWLSGGEAFRQLSALDQLPYVRRYFAPHKGRLVSAAACYVAVFLPSLMPHAGDPTFVLCGKAGPLAWAYAPNIGFDRAKKGTIIVKDLQDAMTRACVGPRWNEIRDRMRQALGLEPTGPDTEPTVYTDHELVVPKDPPDDAA